MISSYIPPFGIHFCDISLGVQITCPTKIRVTYILSNRRPMPQHDGAEPKIKKVREAPPKSGIVSPLAGTHLPDSCRHLCCRKPLHRSSHLQCRLSACITYNLYILARFHLLFRLYPIFESRFRFSMPPAHLPPYRPPSPHPRFGQHHQ